jgi:hypothetical protein
MKYSNRIKRFPRVWTLAALLASSFATADLLAEDQAANQSKPAISQRAFASPEEAVKALKAATEAHDKSALRDLFGPEFDELQTAMPPRTRRMRKNSQPPWLTPASPWPLAKIMSPWRSARTTGRCRFRWSSRTGNGASTRTRGRRDHCASHRQG